MEINLSELVPFLATAGGVFMTYLALGRWIKAWIVSDCITKDQHEHIVKHIKKDFKEEIQRCVDQVNKDIEKNTVWLRDLDHKADRGMVEMSGLQEAINGIRERLRESH
jgi:peptidoglycan hydrolase CwlO-like protein